MKRNNNIDSQEQIYCAIALKNEIIKTSSCGDYDFCIRTAAYYRSIGYNGKCVTYENFLEMLEQESQERMKSKTFACNL